MDSSAPNKKLNEAARKSGLTRKKTAWILGGGFDSWCGVAMELGQWGIEAKLLGSNSDLADIASQAERAGGVIVVDLVRDVERGMGTVKSCHSFAPSVPIIPVVSDPSLDLAQRLRGLGAFCLAVHPPDAPKMRTVLEEAFRKVSKLRPASQPDKKKILVIDDDRDYCSSIEMLLKREGYDVACAWSGSQGLEMAVANKPDLIILDVMMETVWAGYEVNQTLKFRSGYESVRKVPIVMVSSLEQHPSERFARTDDPSRVGPDVYLTKPVEVSSFVETVRSLLRGAPA
jgi:CheY-like chemotaxis protein